MRYVGIFEDIFGSDTHPVDSAANCSRHRRTNGWDPAVVNRSRWKGWDGYCVPMVSHFLAFLLRRV